MPSGVHYSHSPCYIRRVRIIATDPLCCVCEEPGYPVLPEVGQDPKNPTTKVLEFSVKAPAGRIKGDAAAIEQLENYKKMLMEHYLDHNCSITVHVRENEWEDVEHWDDVVALSFTSNAFFCEPPLSKMNPLTPKRGLFVSQLEPFAQKAPQF